MFPAWGGGEYEREGRGQWERESVSGGWGCAHRGLVDFGSVTVSSLNASVELSSKSLGLWGLVERKRPGLRVLQHAARCLSRTTRMYYRQTDRQTQRQEDRQTREEGGGRVIWRYVPFLWK